MTHDKLVDRLCELASEAARQLRASDQLIAQLASENDQLRAQRDAARAEAARRP